MPYQKIGDLPDRVTSHLPAHAQEIFLAAFNHAFEEYQRDEERSFRVAWSAVESRLRKRRGRRVAAERIERHK